MSPITDKLKYFISSYFVKIEIITEGYSFIEKDIKCQLRARQYPGARDVAAHQTERPVPLEFTFWCQRQNKQLKNRM